MLEKFYPDLTLHTIYELDFQKLKERHIALLMFDIDNTLVPYFEPNPSPEVTAFFSALTAAGFSLALVSNNSAQRVNLFNKDLSLYCVPRANKPFAGQLKRTMAHFEQTTQTSAIIGDQLFTDVYAGKRLGMFSVYVTPLAFSRDTKETPFFRFKRAMERKVFAHQEKRNQSV